MYTFVYLLSASAACLLAHRSKGFAYVEMKSLESLPLVLQLNDRVPDFQKFPVMVKASEAEKNYLAKQASLLSFRESMNHLQPVSYCRYFFCPYVVPLD